jgi:hypothetical protein
MINPNLDALTNEDRKKARNELEKQFCERLDKAVKLKNHILEKSTTGLPGQPAVPDIMEIAKKLNRLQWRHVHYPEKIPGEEELNKDFEHVKTVYMPSVDDLNELDQCIADLEKISDTVTKPDMPSVPKPLPINFNLVLWLLTIVGLFGAIFGFVTAANGFWTVFEGDSLLAASLGLLGGVAFSFFDVLGVVPSADYDGADWARNFARLLLGVLLGWVFYFAFAQSAFANFANTKSGAAASGIVILLPFLAGYSTALVVAILDKAIKAMNFALGLEEKSTSARRSSNA